MDPVQSDPGCHAKTAIAEALQKIGSPEAESVFLRGVHYVQMEPVFGGREDAAVSLRGVCGLALAQCGHPRAVWELAELLADGEASARTAAAARSVTPGGSRPFHSCASRCSSGTRMPASWQSGFSALLHLSPEASLPFVAGYLGDRREAVAEAAAISLGESRLPEAFAPLSDWWREPPPSALRPACLLAFALLRSAQALEVVFEAVRSAPVRDALAAVRALATYPTIPSSGREPSRRQKSARAGKCERQSDAPFRWSGVETRDEMDLSARNP